MSWFRRNTSDNAIAMLRAQVDELAERLAAAEAANQPDDAEPAQPEPAPLPAPPLGSTSEDRSRLDTITERLDALDARITSVSTELAHQLDELSGEIDRADGSEFTMRLDEAVAAIRHTTEALAAEQARYEMQFRADLAEVADRATRGR
ncbi:MAG: hypothetical protein AAGA42_06875 [Actinomycetota bacterium]